MSTNYLQVTGPGVCYAHGPYSGSECPQFPACATDPQRPEFVKLGNAQLAPREVSCPHKWISVDERLPEKRAPMFKHYVLAVDVRGRMSVGYLWDNGGWTFAKPISEPRYWMELPDPPIY